MKIDVYVLCKNEAKIAPFMIDYWKALAEDVNVYVYDGLSNDGTRELFSQHSWIHVIDFEPDALNDNEHIKLKNSCWKGSEADFVMVCDFDETIFSYNTKALHEELDKMKKNGETILSPLSFSLIPDEFPTYKKGKFLHELCQYGFNDYIWEAKPILFNPKQITDINFVHGGHVANPTGNVKWCYSDKLFIIHAKFVGFDYYCERIKNRVLSEWNVKNKLMGEVDKAQKDMENTFESYKKVRFKWSDVKKNFSQYYKIRHDWTKWKFHYNVDCLLYKNTTPTLDIHVLCYNEMILAPFMVDYWKKIARHVYVYDNGSNDGVVEFLSQFDWITVRHYNSDGLNDEAFRQIKNNCWRGSDADWVWVCDFDEIVYDDNFQEKLKTLDNNGYSVCKTRWVFAVSKESIGEHVKGKLLHEVMNGWVCDDEKKILLFKPKEISDMKYSYGSHLCNPVGKVKIYDSLTAIHFKHIGIENTINKYHQNQKRMSEFNKKTGCSFHYFNSDQQIESEINEYYNKSKPITEILKEICQK